MGIRMIFGVSRYTSSTKYFRDLRILKVTDPCNYACSIFRYNFNMKQLLTVFDDYFIRNRDDRLRNTGQDDQL